MPDELEGMKRALERISEGRGRYSRDPLTHAANTIDDMKQTALDALNGKYPEVSDAG